MDWRRFRVSVIDGDVVACAQVKVHRGGARELASVVVVPLHRGRGLGRATSEAAIAREPVRPLYLFAESRVEAFWGALGFGPADSRAIPSDLGRSLWIGRFASAVVSAVTRERYRIIMMRRDER